MTIYLDHYMSLHGKTPIQTLIYEFIGLAQSVGLQSMYMARRTAKTPDDGLSAG